MSVLPPSHGPVPIERNATQDVRKLSHDLHQTLGSFHKSMQNILQNPTAIDNENELNQIAETIFKLDQLSKQATHIGG